SSLRLLGSVGEPINPEAWVWYREHVGSDRTPVVDTWWQTETGMILITPLPGVTTLKPGSATRAFPGGDAAVFGGQGRGGGPGGRGLCGRGGAVAGGGARDLPRPRPLRGHVLEPLRRRLLRRGRGAGGRGRRLLAAGTCR